MRHFMLSMFFLGLALCEDSPIITSINGRGKDEYAAYAAEDRRGALETSLKVITTWIAALACNFHLHYVLFSNRSAWQLVVQLASFVITPSFPIVGAFEFTISRLVLCMRERDSVTKVRRGTIRRNSSDRIKNSLAKLMCFHATSETTTLSFPLAAVRPEDDYRISTETKEWPRAGRVGSLIAISLAAVYFGDTAAETGHRVFSEPNAAAYFDHRAFWIATSGVFICFESLVALWINLSFRILPPDCGHNATAPSDRSLISQSEKDKTEPSSRDEPGKGKTQDEHCGPNYIDQLYSNLDCAFSICMTYYIIFFGMKIVHFIYRLRDRSVLTINEGLDLSPQIKSALFGRAGVWIVMYCLMAFVRLVSFSNKMMESIVERGVGHLFLLGMGFLFLLKALSSSVEVAISLYDRRLGITALVISGVFTLARVLLPLFRRTNPLKADLSMDVAFLMAWLVVYEILLVADSMFRTFAIPEHTLSEDIPGPQLASGRM